MVTNVMEIRRTAAAPDEQTIADAYIYLLGRTLAIRQEHIDRRAPRFTYNTIRVHPLAAPDYVNPNFDVATLEAWIAVDERTPVMLELPVIRERYHTTQIVDGWGEVIVNINERTLPLHPHGKFAFLAPGSTAHVPIGAARIQLHGNKAKLIARIEIKDDPEEVQRLQRQFRLTPLGAPVIEPPPSLRTFSTRDLAGVEMFDDVATKLASALDVSPIAAELQQKVHAVEHYVRTAPGARAAVDHKLRTVVIPGFIKQVVARIGVGPNQWFGGEPAGNYGRDFRLRTAVNLRQIWSNTPDELVSYSTTRDIESRPLVGDYRYIVRFPAGALPSAVVDSHWSMSLVSVPDQRVAQNPLERYCLTSRSPLRKSRDGSLKIGVGPSPISGVPDANWLPSPTGKPFALTFRAYAPKAVVTSGEWTLPAVTPLV